MSELTCKFKTEYRRYTGDEEDVIEGRTANGESIKGPVPTKNGLPKSRDVLLLGDWKNNGRGRMFNFHSYVEEHQIDQVRRIQAMIEKRGFNRKIPAQCVRMFGSNAAFAVDRNPYVLMQFPSASFDRCDRMWLDFGRNPKALKRQVLLLVDLMDKSQHGHVWYKGRTMESFLRDKMGKDARFNAAVNLAWKIDAIAMKTDGSVLEGGELWIAHRELADAEQAVAEWIKERIQGRRGWPRDVAGLLLEDQYEAVQKATQKGIGLLLGGGGTGKTYAISRMILKIGDLSRCKLCAPTGKAAVRMAQAVAEAFEGTAMEGKKIEATTIHRLIALKKYRSMQDEYWGRKKQEAQFYFVDETSMLDIKIMAEFLSVIPPDASVLFVGDPSQLPPVGPGAPLRDMLSLDSCGTITKTRRNGGMILDAGAAIREGQQFQTCTQFMDDENLVHVPASEDRAIDELRELVLSLVDGDSVKPQDVQVLGIVNRNTAVSVSRLNDMLRLLFNPGKDEGYPFRKCDRVINKQNGYFIPDHSFVQSDECIKDSGGNIYVANGEQGYVVEQAGPKMTIHLECPSRRVLVWQKKIDARSQEGATGLSWKLGYAITTHAAQGSQWPYVICMLDGSSAARTLLDKNLVYTMVSRASSCCYLIGDIDVAYRALRTSKIDSRQTFLKEMIS